MTVTTQWRIAAVYTEMNTILKRIRSTRFGEPTVSQRQAGRATEGTQEGTAQAMRICGILHPSRYDVYCQLPYGHSDPWEHGYRDHEASGMWISWKAPPGAPLLPPFLSRGDLAQALAAASGFPSDPGEDIGPWLKVADKARELLAPKVQCPAYPNQNMTPGPDMRCAGELDHKDLHENAVGWRWGEVS